MNIKATRMEMLNYKRKLRIARRGHKLLKDKRDELMRRFLEMIRENEKHREVVEERLSGAYRGLAMARAQMGQNALDAATMFPQSSASLEMSTRNLVGVTVPEMELVTPEVKKSYSLLTTSGELDNALSNLESSLEDIVSLAELERKVHLLAYEIEKTRRRVNALEHILIPQLEHNIRYISQKLAENERANFTLRLVVKGKT